MHNSGVLLNKIHQSLFNLMKKLWGRTIQMKTLWQNIFFAYCAKRNLIHYFSITFFNLGSMGSEEGSSKIINSCPSLPRHMLRCGYFH